MNKILLFLFLFYSSIVAAQFEKDSLAFNFHFKWKTENIEVNKNYITKTDTLQLNSIKFYISAVEINYSDDSKQTEKNSYHLIDIENDKSFKIANNAEKNISKIIFFLRVLS